MIGRGRTTSAGWQLSCSVAANQHASRSKIWSHVGNLANVRSFIDGSNLMHHIARQMAWLCCTISLCAQLYAQSVSVPAVPPKSIIISPDNLNPYLKYPPLQLMQAGGVEPPGPQVGITITALDPTQRGKQIFISNFAVPSSGLYGFDGRN